MKTFLVFRIRWLKNQAQCCSYEGCTEREKKRPQFTTKTFSFFSGKKRRYQMLHKRGKNGETRVFFVPFPFLLRENVSPKKKSFDTLDHLAHSSGEGQHNSTRVVCTVMEEEEAALNKTVGDRGNSRCNKVSPSFSSFSCLFSSSSPLIPCGRQYVRGNSNFSRRVVIFCLGNLNRSFVKKLK